MFSTGAWETPKTSACHSEDSAVPVPPEGLQAVVEAMEDLPGSVPELTDERSIIHKTKLWRPIQY